MQMSFAKMLRVAFAASAMIFTAPTVVAQNASLMVHVHLDRAKGAGHAGMKEIDSQNVVAWLTPVGVVDTEAPDRDAKPQEPYRLVQKDKQFLPHVLVVPVGSNVEFPNLDPFFHNVFSLFNGKRFDLGLYEAGSRRSVRFDREGVSYIFCNIHPEMGAVVVSLRSPWYAISGVDGELAIHGVPLGTYRLHVWAENVVAEQLKAAERVVRIEDGPFQAGDIHLAVSAHAVQDHTNKYGDAYTATPAPPY
jgi:plastocyanin